MIREVRPLAQITAEAIKILYREIGIVDTLRFVNQYTTGYGDYTAQREELFADLTLDNLVAEIRESRRHAHSTRGQKDPGKKTTSDKHVRQTGRQR